MDDLLLERELTAALRKAMVKSGAAAGDTFTIADVFPTLDDELKSLLTKTKSASKAANFTAAQRDYVSTLTLGLFALAMEKLTLTSRRVQRGIDIRQKLEQRIEELEKNKLAYVGPFVAGTEYSRGKFATHAGSLWHCNYATRAKPGDGSDAWTLAVKSPR